MNQTLVQLLDFRFLRGNFGFVPLLKLKILRLGDQPALQIVIEMELRILQPLLLPHGFIKRQHILIFCTVCRFGFPRCINHSFHIDKSGNQRLKRL